MTKRIPETQITDEAPFGQELRQVLAGALEPSEARRVVRRAGRSGEPALLPLLVEIAERTSKESYLRLTFEALCSAWLLGEPEEWFLANARAHRTKKWLAYSSILLLGRDPEDERAAAVLAEIKIQTTDNQISGAIAEAERVRAMAGEYPESGTAEEKIAFLLPLCRGEWSPISSEGTELGWGLKPVTEWARRKLRELSQESPEEVARAMARMDLAAESPDERTTAAYRAFLAGFLSAEARQKLAESIQGAR